MKAKIFTYFIIIVIMALLKIQILTWNHKIWQCSVSLHFSSLPTELNVLFKSLLLLLLGSLLLTATTTRSGQWIALVFLFKNLLRREEKPSMFSHLYITPRHYSMSILFIAVSQRECVEEQVVRWKSEKEKHSFLPWLLKCCALSWASGHRLQCNQNQELAKGMFLCS